MEYKTKYKCRLCGAEFYGPIKTDDLNAVATAMAHMVVNVRGVNPLTPTPTRPHDCGGEHEGSFGLADFQGWEAVP